MGALAENGIPIEHREGVKETFVAVHVWIMKLLVVSGKDVIKALSKIGYYVRDQKEVMCIWDIHSESR